MSFVTAQHPFARSRLPYLTQMKQEHLDLDPVVEFLALPLDNMVIHTAGSIDPVQTVKTLDMITK